MASGIIYLAQALGCSVFLMAAPIIYLGCSVFLMAAQLQL